MKAIQSNETNKPLGVLIEIKLVLGTSHSKRFQQRSWREL